MDCTLLIPTRNRPQLLAAQVRYLAAHPAGLSIIVLDSSSPDDAAKNAALCADLPGVDYRHYPETMPVFEKFTAGFETAATPFSALVPDDDFLFADSLPDILAALEDRPDAAAAHGCYFEYLPSGHTIQVNGLIQSGASIADPRPQMRVLGLMRNYEAVTYAVYRTPAARKTFAIAAKQTEILAQELLQGATAAAYGAILRLPLITHGRRAESTLGYSRWHPLDWLAIDPAGFFAAYGQYRIALVDFIARQPGGSDSDAAATGRIVDLAHLSYLSPYLDSDTLAGAADFDPAAMSEADMQDAVRELWAKSKGPQWARALRGHGFLSANIRRLAKKHALRHRLQALTRRLQGSSQRDVIVTETGTVNVRFDTAFHDDLAAQRWGLAIRPNRETLAAALANREFGH